LFFTTATQVTTQAINQPTASDATISWLSQAHLDCYLHGQGFIASMVGDWPGSSQIPAPGGYGQQEYLALFMKLSGSLFLNQI
jgi:hypothetical protein